MIVPKLLSPKSLLLKYIGPKVSCLTSTWMREKSSVSSYTVYPNWAGSLERIFTDEIFIKILYKIFEQRAQPRFTRVPTMFEVALTFPLRRRGCVSWSPRYSAPQRTRSLWTATTMYLVICWCGLKSGHSATVSHMVGFFLIKWALLGYHPMS